MPYVYAPGCALTDYKPHIVDKILRFLRAHVGEMALYDTCCRLEELDLPDGTTIINTCPGCNRRFQEKRECIRTVSLWEVLCESDAFPFPDYGGMTLAIHDACPTRNAPQVHAAVRKLLRRMHIRVAEPERTMERQECCGDSAYPEQPLPEIYRRMKQRADDMPADEVCVYCVSCVKAMHIGGKAPRYLVDLLFSEPTIPDVYPDDSFYKQFEAFHPAP